MKKSIIATLLFLAMAFSVSAASLQWDTPTDWDKITGYVVYFNEAGQTDTPYSKTVLKASVVKTTATVTLANMDTLCNLQYGQDYTMWLKAYNAAGESGASNTVAFAKPGWAPPGDMLPEGSLITIPNAAVTIQIK